MAERNQQFDNFQEWVNKASSWLTRRIEREGRDNAICFDTKGRRCWIGGDFMRARDEKTFPVKWIWPDQIPALLDLAEEAYKGDDFSAWLRHQGEPE